MRGILYQFDSYEMLADQLDVGGDEQELGLPDASGLRDGEWVLATFCVGEEATSIAACAMDRGDGLCLCFADRDWERLGEFSRRGGPKSAPPSSVHSPEVVCAPPNARVLVVDDDDDVLCMLRSILRSVGFRVETVSSAEDAIDYLRRDRADLVVLDFSLPGMSGVELLTRLRRDPALIGLPVLFLSAHCSTREVAAAFDAGADDFVGKPFRAHELGARILGLLRRARPSFAAGLGC